MSSHIILDLMDKDFALITPEMSVAEATHRLLQHDMVGGPVVNREGILQGWISEQECLQVTIQVLYHNHRVPLVKDMMRTNVMTVSPSDDPLNLAQQMLRQRPKNYTVVDVNNRVLGVISRRHLLKMLDAELVRVARRA